MERSNFFGDEYVFAEDLNNVESTKGHALKQRILAFFAPQPPTGSVVGQPGSPYLQAVANTTTEIVVRAGMAIDVDGELIDLSTDLTVTLGDNTTLESWLSSGSPGTGRVKIRYAEVTGSIKTDDDGNPYPTRYTDSYKVVIDVDTVPTAQDVLLGTFAAAADGSCSGVIVIDNRRFLRATSFDEHTYLAASPIAGHTTVKDHVLAKGSGPQTNSNPHGMTAADIGLGTSSIPTFTRITNVNETDVTPSRNFWQLGPPEANIYQNTKGTTMFLSISVAMIKFLGSGSAAVVTLYVGTVPALASMHPVALVYNDNVPPSGLGMQLCAFVPPGYYYTLVTTHDISDFVQPSPWIESWTP